MVVDDDANIRDALCGNLTRQGFAASAAADAAARERLARGGVDLVVLDIMMPGEDGLSLCRHLRESANTPVILLTALADDTDRIVGLEIGADDYVTKPFNPRELVARIKAVLRRAHAGDQPTGAGDRLRFADWTVDLRQCELARDDGLIVPLSTGEMSLLRVFLDRPAEVLSRDDLMAATKGRDVHPFERSIDNTISRLRRKIEHDPKTPRVIRTVWGGGYEFVADVRPA